MQDGCYFMIAVIYWIMFYVNIFKGSIILVLCMTLLVGQQFFTEVKLEVTLANTSCSFHMSFPDNLYRVQ